MGGGGLVNAGGGIATTNGGGTGVDRNLPNNFNNQA